MSKIKQFFLASLLFGVFTQANAAIITQELLVNDGDRDIVVGSLSVDTANGEAFSSDILEFSESSLFELTLFGFDFTNEWSIDYLNAGLEVSNLFAGFIDISFDLGNMVSGEYLAFFADSNEYSFDHYTLFDANGLAAWGPAKLGNVSVVSEPMTIAAMALGLALLGARRKFS